MRQRLALVAVEQNDVARLGLLLAQLQTQAGSFDLGGDLAMPSACAAAGASGTFFAAPWESCDRLMRTPSHASISTCSRGIVQLRRSATGCSSKGVTTRKAASSSPGPDRAGATLALQPLAAAHEVAAPQANRVLAHAGSPRRSGDSSSRPASTAQRALCVRLAAITRFREAPQRHSLLLARRQQRLARHLQPPANHRSSPYSESQPASVGEPVKSA